MCDVYAHLCGAHVCACACIYSMAALSPKDQPALELSGLYSLTHSFPQVFESQLMPGTLPRHKSEQDSAQKGQIESRVQD